ncbi:hypothetical protein AMS57_15460 [Pseudoalteromonas undina]|uniref:hypothetical protein n=1 Tax=Pseudoalteromonas undina TaxID=43660 RepID=UPI0006BB397A|nr:hypothetical protein [Pseudoalteromonas undina]KPH89793.1 hypothetical protein AMS57_15460 [Pseudoalteromonas undina]
MQRIYCILLTLTLLLTFVGQAVASVSMVCDMPHTNMATHTSMQHSKMAMSDDADTTTLSMDCCSEQSTLTQDCSCPMSACSSHSALHVNSLFIASKLPSEKVQHAVIQHQVNFARSLYRPPMPA